MQAYIYGIKNIINGQYYIGQTINYKQRIQKHQSDLRLGTHSNHYLQRSYDKHGVDAFEYELIEIVEDYSEIGERERHWISALGHYNIDTGRNGFTPQALRNLKDKPVLNLDKRKMTPKQVFYALALTDFIENIVRPLARIYGLSRAPLKGLQRRQTYLEYCSMYDKLSLDKKLIILRCAMRAYGFVYAALDLGYKTPLRNACLVYANNVLKMSRTDMSKVFGITKDSISRGLRLIRSGEREIDTSYQPEEICKIFCALVNDNPVLSPYLGKV